MSPTTRFSCASFGGPSLIPGVCHARSARSAEELLQDRGGPGWDIFAGKELHADLQGRLGGVDPDDACEQAEVLDVSGPSCERLHREDVARRGRCYPQSRSPKEVNARSSCARSKRTFPGSLTPLPSLQRRGRRRAYGRRRARGPGRQRVGPAAPRETTAAATHVAQSRPGERGRV